MGVCHKICILRFESTVDNQLKQFSTVYSFDFAAILEFERCPPLRRVRLFREKMKYRSFKNMESRCPSSSFFLFMKKTLDEIETNKQRWVRNIWPIGTALSLTYFCTVILTSNLTTYNCTVYFAIYCKNLRHNFSRWCRQAKILQILRSIASQYAKNRAQG